MIKRSLLIVSGSRTAPGAPLLREAAKRRGIDASVIYLDNPKVADLINEAEKVLFRASPKMLPKYKKLLDHLQEPKKRLLSKTIDAFSKINIYNVLTESGVPTPASYVIPRSGRVHQYPVVIKIPNGYQGQGVELLENETDFLNFLAKFSTDDEFLVQEFIEESKGSDKRLFIVDGRCIAAMKRTSQSDDFRANIHLGGVMETYQPTRQEVEFAVMATRAFGLQFAGVDLVDSNRGPLVLEINPSPGFGIQSTTDISIADVVVDTVLKS